EARVRLSPRSFDLGIKPGRRFGTDAEPGQEAPRENLLFLPDEAAPNVTVFSENIPRSPSHPAESLGMIRSQGDTPGRRRLPDQALAQERRAQYHPSVGGKHSTRRFPRNLVTSGQGLSGRKVGDLMEFLDDPA